MSAQLEKHCAAWPVNGLMSKRVAKTRALRGQTLSKFRPGLCSLARNLCETTAKKRSSFKHRSTQQKLLIPCQAGADLKEPSQQTFRRRFLAERRGVVVAPSAPARDPWSAPGVLRSLHQEEGHIPQSGLPIFRSPAKSD